MTVYCKERVRGVIPPFQVDKIHIYIYNKSNSYFVKGGRYQSSFSNILRTEKNDKLRMQ